MLTTVPPIKFLFEREDTAARNGDARIHGGHGAFLPENSDGYLHPAGVAFFTPDKGWLPSSYQG